MPKTITLTNIMANNEKGWFPATLGNCSWQSSTRTPGDGAKSSVKIIPSGGGECTLTSAEHDLVASHKYYISFKVFYDSAANCTFDWYWPVAEPSAASGLRVNAAAQTWTRASSVFERTSFADGRYPCRFDYNNENGNVAFSECRSEVVGFQAGVMESSCGVRTTRARTLPECALPDMRFPAHTSAFGTKVQSRRIRPFL